MIVVYFLVKLILIKGLFIMFEMIRLGLYKYFIVLIWISKYSLKDSNRGSILIVVVLRLVLVNK